jgi:hypothetical protein
LGKDVVLRHFGELGVDGPGRCKKKKNL